MLWDGFVGAVGRYATRFDLNNVGFLGHSYGGGATATMAYKGLVEEGWGAEGACLFVMAPFFALEITDAQLRSLPSHTNLIVQVYNDDTMAPDSIALNLYSKLSSIPIERKAFYYVAGGHSEPSNLTVDDIDRLGIHKPLDALMDYTFKIDSPEEGRIFALVPGGDRYLTTVLKDPMADWDDPINQPPTDPPAYEITASAGANGQISPAGTTTVNHGGSQTYTITPDAGYEVSDVTADGNSVGAVTSYTFSGVDSDHTIAATFEWFSWWDWWRSRRGR